MQRLNLTRPDRPYYLLDIPPTNTSSPSPAVLSVSVFFFSFVIYYYWIYDNGRACVLIVGPRAFWVSESAKFVNNLM